MTQFTERFSCLRSLGCQENSRYFFFFNFLWNRKIRKQNSFQKTPKFQTEAFTELERIGESKRIRGGYSFSFDQQCSKIDFDFKQKTDFPDSNKINEKSFKPFFIIIYQCNFAGYFPKNLFYSNRNHSRFSLPQLKRNGIQK